MNILILSAGNDKGALGDSYPLCLAEFESKPLIQRVIASCLELNPSSLIVTFLREDLRNYHLDDIVTLLWRNAITISAPEKTAGAACTALLASAYIDNPDELLIINGNEFIDASFSEIVTDFRKRGLDAGVVVFDSIHPRYSYVALNDDNQVIRASEKRPISNNATAGFYWYAKGNEFVDATKAMIRKDARVNENFFICPAFNELILQRKRIGIFRLKNSQYHPLKNSRQVDSFESISDKYTKNE